jgi:hypothetical protein
MARKIERIHVMHMSAQFADSDEKTKEDFVDAFKRDPDVISFTEMGSDTNVKMLRHYCREYKYRLYLGDAGKGLNGDDCCIAVRTEGRNVQFRDGGHIRVHPGQDKPESQGGRYGPKGVTWVKFNFFGVDAYHHVAHWVHNQNEAALNRKRSLMVSSMIAKQVRLHGKKGNIAFFAGDMNLDPDAGTFPHDLFRRNKLVTIWEDGGQKPTHGNRSIDMIGRYGADKRVEFVRYETHKANSDHRPVSAFYDVQIDKYAPQDHPPSGDPDDDDGPVFHAGNRNWADYRDNDIYNLPEATDDSDQSNG